MGPTPAIRAITTKYTTHDVAKRHRSQEKKRKELTVVTGTEHIGKQGQKWRSDFPKENMTHMVIHHIRPTELYPKRDLAEKRKALYFQSVSNDETTVIYKTARPRTCSKGCPATMLKKRSRPSLLLSITSSENLLVNTFPGRGGILTRVDSCSRISRNASKSE